MTDLEKLTKQIMKECEDDGEPVTEEEAKEMAEMELKSKANVKRYEQSKPKAKTPKERKIDNAKLELFNIIIDSLSNTVEKGNLKNEVEYSFEYKNENYTLKLTKHRKTKA